MKDWILSVMDSLGYWGVALLMFLENIVPPIPSEIIMPAAGFSARNGNLNFWLVVLVGSIGSLAGAVPWYCLARYLGRPGLVKLIERFGGWVGISTVDLDRSDVWFQRRGKAAVFLGRLVPGVRTLISVPAGVAKMDFVTFLLYSAFGTVLWTFLLAGAGWLLRDRYDVLEPYFNWIGLAAVAGVALWLAWWIAKRRREQLRAHQQGEPGPAGERSAPKTPGRG